ncbi:hypothetical protein [Streptomyces sp. NPDC003090]|uniref:hypothetical protein n=1 Tax=Streptomyces sp. NPDC003090 TaxID=3154274 RepID=UPI00382DD2ED
MTPGRRPVRMCVRCDRITESPVVVSEVHQDSGPGWSVYACPGCAPHFPPLPDEGPQVSHRTRECQDAPHSLCTPMEVYASDRPGPGEEPFFSITCGCLCHRTAPAV